MAECPNGHTTVTGDYCDQCGAKMAGDQAPAPSVAVPSGTNSCPNCQSPYGPDDKFCEVCGYDFATGTLPVAPVPVAAAPILGEPPSPAGPPWEAVVSADRDYYERTAADTVTFPEHCPERVFTLTVDEVLIGRRSESRGIHPQIDLSGAPEDTAISRSHALLRRGPDGLWALIDPGSTNGTWLNDDLDPLAHAVAIPVGDGARIYLGAWTRIVLRAPNPAGIPTDLTLTAHVRAGRHPPGAPPLHGDDRPDALDHAEGPCPTQEPVGR